VPDDGDTLIFPDTLDGSEADQFTVPPLAARVSVAENGATSVIDDCDTVRVPLGELAGGLALVVRGAADRDAATDGLALSGGVLTRTRVLGAAEGAELCPAGEGAGLVLGALDALVALDALLAAGLEAVDAPAVWRGLLAATGAAGVVPPPEESAITRTTTATAAAAAKAPTASRRPPGRAAPLAVRGFGKPVPPNDPAPPSIFARASVASASYAVTSHINRSRSRPGEDGMDARASSAALSSAPGLRLSWSAGRISRSRRAAHIPHCAMCRVTRLRSR
jgi:hypothetical protein